jgi:hypothetical protein
MRKRASYQLSYLRSDVDHLSIPEKRRMLNVMGAM